MILSLHLSPLVLVVALIDEMPQMGTNKTYLNQWRAQTWQWPLSGIIFLTYANSISSQAVSHLRTVLPRLAKLHNSIGSCTSTISGIREKLPHIGGTQTLSYNSLVYATSKSRLNYGHQAKELTWKVSLRYSSLALRILDWV